MQQTGRKKQTRTDQQWKTEKMKKKKKKEKKKEKHCKTVSKLPIQILFSVDSYLSFVQKEFKMIMKKRVIITSGK